MKFIAKLIKILKGLKKTENTARNTITWHNASEGQPEIGKPFLNMAASGGITIYVRDEKHILDQDNRWLYIEEILPEDCDTETAIRLTMWFNERFN